MSKFIDATVSIRPGIAVYEGDPEVFVESISSIKRGDPYNLLSLSLSSHTGTHLDAPSHFFQSGKTLDDIPLELLFGRVRVIQVRDTRSVTRKSFQHVSLEGVDKVLFKTDHSFLRDRYTRFRSNYVYLEVDACGHLVQNGIKLVGIDTFSVDPYGSKDFMCHKVLLGAGILIIELIDLKDVEPGDYEMYCLPLKVYKSDGAPVRLVLKPVT